MYYFDFQRNSLGSVNSNAVLKLMGRGGVRGTGAPRGPGRGGLRGILDDLVVNIKDSFLNCYLHD